MGVHRGMKYHMVHLAHVTPLTKKQTNKNKQKSCYFCRDSPTEEAEKHTLAIECNMSY